MASVRHVGFAGHIFGLPTKTTEGIYHLAKFGWNRCSGFDNMKVLIFGTFGLKMPIHDHKIWGVGKFDPLNGKPPPMRPPEGINSRKNTSSEPLSVKIAPKL